MRRALLISAAVVLSFAAAVASPSAVFAGTDASGNADALREIGRAERHLGCDDPPPAMDYACRKLANATRLLSPLQNAREATTSGTSARAGTTSGTHADPAPQATQATRETQKRTLPPEPATAGATVAPADEPATGTKTEPYLVCRHDHGGDLHTHRIANDGTGRTMSGDGIGGHTSDAGRAVWHKAAADSTYTTWTSDGLGSLIDVGIGGKCKVSLRR